MAEIALRLNQQDVECLRQVLRVVLLARADGTELPGRVWYRSSPHFKALGRQIGELDKQASSGELLVSDEGRLELLECLDTAEQFMRRHRRGDRQTYQGIHALRVRLRQAGEGSARADEQPPTAVAMAATSEGAPTVWPERGSLVGRLLRKVGLGS